MNYCPECGVRIRHQGYFCEECGSRLPEHLSSEPATAGSENATSCFGNQSDALNSGNNPNQVDFHRKSHPVSFGKESDGFSVVHRALSAPVSFGEPRRRSRPMKFGGVCDFAQEEFHILIVSLQGIGDFLNEMYRRYGDEKYVNLIHEWETDIRVFMGEIENFLDQGIYPSPLSPFLPGIRTFLQNTIAALLQAGEEEYRPNIESMNLSLVVIDIVETADYDKNGFFSRCPMLASNEDGESAGTAGQSRSEGTSAEESPLQSDSGDAPDFKEKIEALERDLEAHSPSFNINEYDPEKDYDKELENLIGLKNLKSQLNDFFDNFNMQLRRQKAHPELKVGLSYNCIFKGKPGTGKTTVARIMAGLLRQKGILKGGRSVEVDASSLVSGWIGFSAKIATLAAYKAMDGVLFIDEAYAIMNNYETGRGAGPGKDVIDALTPIMENYRDRLIVVMAGYDKEMEEFLKASNTGLPSRFKAVMQFEDYNADEMTEIFCSVARSRCYALEAGAIARLRQQFDYIYNSIPSLPAFANARTVRRMLEQVEYRHTRRVKANPAADIDLITEEDVKLSPDEINLVLGCV